MKINFRWLLKKSMKPFNVDDMSAFFSGISVDTFNDDFTLDYRILFFDNFAFEYSNGTGLSGYQIW